MPGPVNKPESPSQCVCVLFCSFFESRACLLQRAPELVSFLVSYFKLWGNALQHSEEKKKNEAF